MHNKYNILIVDDEVDYREIFSLILSEKGYNVFKSSCIKEAKEIIQNNRIDMVISDLIMKNETGIELLYWIREYNEEIGVIIVVVICSIKKSTRMLKCTNNSLCLSVFFNCLSLQ